MTKNRKLSFLLAVSNVFSDLKPQAAVLIVVLFIQHTAMADEACTILNAPLVTISEITVSSIYCERGNAKYNNHESIIDEAVIDNTTYASVLLDGQGNTFSNSSQIRSNATLMVSAKQSYARYGVLIGNYTLSRGVPKAVDDGGEKNTIRLLPSQLTTPQLIGKKLFLRSNVRNKEAWSGDYGVIAAYDPSTQIVKVNASTKTGNWKVKPKAGQGYNVVAGFGVNTFNNSGVIAATIGINEIAANTIGNNSASNTSAVKAVGAVLFGDYIFNNTGVIKATHAGVGGLIALDGGGDVINMIVNNSGTIGIERLSELMLGTNDVSGLTVSLTNNKQLNGQGFVPSAVVPFASQAAVYAEEELEKITVNNSAGGVIESTGNFAPALYLRAEKQTLINKGIVRANTVNGIAVASVPDSGEIRKLSINNSGTISGAILAVNSHALRWYTLSTLGNVDDRLHTNSNWGQLDSVIRNGNSINGDLYFSNGKHVLNNQLGATLHGDVDVDQRDTFCNNQSGCAVGEELGAFTKQHGESNFTVTGAKEFTFNNSGVFIGDITIRTASSEALENKKISSKVVLMPNITGVGATTPDEASFRYIAGFDGNLKVWDGEKSTISSTTLIKPRLKKGVKIKNGTWYKLAKSIEGDSLPQVQDSAQIDWTIAKNTRGELVLGANIQNDH